MCLISFIHLFENFIVQQKILGKRPRGSDDSLTVASVRSVRNCESSQVDFRISFEVQNLAYFPCLKYHEPRFSCH